MNDNQNLRIASLDILRAFTMLLMIFVNDLWSLKGIPGWLEHTPAKADDMGLADTVFPAFLFLVGMSIPLSVQQRKQKGDGKGKIVWHILERSVALLIMGLFLVNGEYINEAATGMQRGIWNILCCTSFILLWNKWPEKIKPWIILLAKLIGAVILLVLAWLYRGGEGANIHRFATYWWGILGLIGWAYLISAIVVVLSNNNFYIILLAWLLFLFVCVSSHSGWIPAGSIIATMVAPFGGGAMPAFTMGGAVTTLILLYFRKRKDTRKMLLVFLGLAVILFLAGIYTRQFWGISKIRATPAWVLICSAITIAVFIPVYWLADQKRKANWFRLIQPAGTNTLLCYLLPYFAYALITLLPLSLPDALLTGAVGLIKSFVFALLIVIITGWLGKWGVRLKL